MARETLSGTNYVLRPVYDEMLDEFGSPPLGYPDECKFHWPDKPLAVVTPGSSKGRYIYVGANANVDLRDLDDDVVVIRLPDSNTDDDAVADTDGSNADDDGEDTNDNESHNQD